MLHLSLEAINLIDVIARTGSFSGAAEVLHKAPSTISYTVSKLEEQLGMCFFERHGPKVTLTPLGKSALDEGRHLLFAASNLEQRLQRLSKGVEPELIIALHASLTLTPYLEDLAAFEKEKFGTQVYFIREAYFGAWDALVQRRADLIIAHGDVPTGNYRTVSLGTLYFDFCVAPDHPLASEKQPLTGEKLLNYPGVTLWDGDTRARMWTPGARLGQHQIVVDSMADKTRIQKMGIAHGYLPRPVARRGVDKGKLVVLQVEEPRKHTVFSLAWRGDSDGPALRWWRKRLSRPLTELSFMDDEML
jgi:DNA-binding transcriptional LysR family regulator